MTDSLEDLVPPVRTYRVTNIMRTRLDDSISVETAWLLSFQMKELGDKTEDAGMFYNIAWVGAEPTEQAPFKFVEGDIVTARKRGTNSLSDWQFVMHN